MVWRVILCVGGNARSMRGKGDLSVPRRVLSCANTHAGQWLVVLPQNECIDH